MATTSTSRGWRPRVGVDLAAVAEVEASIERFGARYLQRVWTDAELDACAGPDRARRLAARFAAKEATAKVLGAPDGPLPWRTIEVVRGPAGRPVLALHAEAAAAAAAGGLADFDVTLSHERDLAVAVVTAVQDDTAREAAQDDAAHETAQDDAAHETAPAPGRAPGTHGGGDE